MLAPRPVLVAASLARTGDVSITVSGGSLRVTGSSGSDSVTIDQEVVSGPHEFRVLPGASTTVNGSASEQTFPGVKKDVVITSGGGADSWFLNVAKVPRDLRLEATVNGSASLSCVDAEIVRDLRIDADGATASPIVIATEIGRNVVFRGGDGPDEMSFDTSVAVGGDIRCDPGGGNDTFQIIQADVRGRITLTQSPGGDALLISDSQVGGAVRAVDLDGGTIVTIRRSTIPSLAVKTGSGMDRVDFDSALVLGSASASLGAGANEFEFSSSTIDGKARFRGGPDNDQVVIDTNTEFVRGMRFALGDGAASINASNWSSGGNARVTCGAAADSIIVALASIAGSLRFDLGDSSGGANQLTLNTCRITKSLSCFGKDGDDVCVAAFTAIGGDLRFALGNGENQGVTTATLCRDLRIAAGAQDDVISIGNDSKVAGDARIDAGNGANTMAVHDATVRGNLSVKAGTGNDFLSIAGAAVIVGKTKVDLGSGTNTGPLGGRIGGDGSESVARVPGPAARDIRRD